MTGWHVFRKESYQPRSVVVWALLALCGGSSWAAQTNASSGQARHEYITLTNIQAEKAKALLGRLKLATASKLPGSNALLVTAEPAELQKAVAVLDLIDSRTEFGILDLGPATNRQIPAGVQIAAVAGGLSLGTFANPPQDKSKLRAIVDVHNGSLVAIAPAFQLKTIDLAMARERETASAKNASAPTVNETPLVQPPAVGAPAGSHTQADRIVGATRLTTVASPGTIQTPALLEARFSGDSAAPTAEPKAQPQGPASSDTTSEPVASAVPLSAGATPAAAPSNAQPAEPAQPAPVASAPAAPTGATLVTQTPAPAPLQPTRSAAEPKFVAPQPAAPTGSTLVMQTPLPEQPQTTPAAAMPQVQPVASPFRPADAADGDKVLDLTLPDRMPVIYLLDLVGKHLGLSYVYNPDDVKGEVTLKLNGDLHGVVRVKDLYPLLEQSLRQLNLVTTRHKGNVVAIAPAARAVELDPLLIDGNLARVESGDTVVTGKFELKYIETAAAKTLLDNMKLGLEPVTAIPEKHMLIVTSYAYRMERVQQLLRMVDQPGEPKQFRYRQLRYTMAKTLADKVKAMAEQMLESVTVTVAESEGAAGVTATPPRQAGETDAAYRTRVAAFRAQQAAQLAAQRAQRQALGAPVGAEAKSGVYLDADERTNRVLMIGAEKQLVVVDQLVGALDVQQQDLRALQLYRMKHVDAADVAQKLLELNIISKLPDSTGGANSRYPYGASAPRITPQLPGQPRPPTTPGTPESQISSTTEVTEKGLVEEPQVVVVEATNSLLVNATAEQHAKIANIVEFVDSETLTTEIPYKIYPLENSSPTSLSEILMKLIQETVEQQKEGGKIEKVVVNKDEKIKIVPDPNTYSLIVYANKRNQEWISNLISQLDKRRPQVLIDVTLVSITRNDKFDYDLNFVSSSPNLTNTSGITGVAPTDKTLGKVIQTGAAGLTAFYGDKQIQALLDTMQSKTYGRVLAKPKLLVNDNEIGKVDNKETTYVETTSALPVASGVPGTSTGLVQTSTNWQNYDAGVMLEITPHISEGDLLRLDIKLTRSDFGVMLGNRPPDKKTSEVQTGVTLPNGATVILGGMLKMNQTKSGSGVPLLQDIPLLGGLFKSIHNSQVDENLYMFVKAEIIRPDDAAGRGMKELEVLSERNRQAFEKHELEFQNAADWPGLKSKRVPPVKVLDAQ